MKIIKRNAVVITVLIFVCAAVYLNWSYNTGEQETDTQVGDMILGSEDAGITAADPDAALMQEETDADEEESGLYYKEENAESVSQQFDAVRLSRQQARDSAAETLKSVTETGAASQEIVDEAMEKMVKLADWTTKEAELESMILSKGFEECVVFMSEEGVTVTVAVSQETLSQPDVAKITDIITTETEYTAQELKIVEIK